MATRRELSGRIVSTAETTELIDRLARRKALSQGVVESAPDYEPTGSAASLSLTNEGLLRVEATQARADAAFFARTDTWPASEPDWLDGEF